MIQTSCKFNSRVFMELRRQGIYARGPFPIRSGFFIYLIYDCIFKESELIGLLENKSCTEEEIKKLASQIRRRAIW